MASARRLYRLQAGLGAVGLAVTAFALAVAVTRVRFNIPSLDPLGAACRQAGLTELRLTSVLVLLLSSLGLAVIVLAVRSAVSQLRSRRRLRGKLRAIGRTEVGDVETLIIDDSRPQAFCIGLLRPRIYVSRGALDLLGDDELVAVVAHEAHHARHHDPLRILIARALGDALFFLPALRPLAERYAALAELAADEAAVRHIGTRRPLAAALLAFDEAPGGAAVGIVPERVDHLLGRRARWELPIVLLAAGAVTVAGLLAVVVRTADATGHATLDMPLLLAQSCMIAMAVLPVVAGATGLLAIKVQAARRRQPARGTPERAA